MRSTNVKTGYILAVASAAFATLSIMLSVLRMFEGVVFSLPAVGANALPGASDGIFMLGTQETSGTAPKIRHVVAVDPGHGGTGGRRAVYKHTRKLGRRWQKQWI